MSTSDQQEHGPLTRKQLREIRLTGSTPVISAEEAAAAAVPPVPPLPKAPEADAPQADAPEVDAPESVPTRNAEAVADRTDDASSAPLTRRQARAQERVRTGSAPVIDAAEESDEGADVIDAIVVEEPPASAEPAQQEPVELEVVPEDSDAAAPSIVAGVPEFSRPAPVVDEDDDEGVDDVETIAPVSAVVTEQDADSEPTAGVESLGLTVDDADPDDVLADVDDTEDAVDDGERPVVNPAFGNGVLREPVESPKPFAPSFDELLTVGDSTGSQHLAPSALIFTPSPGEGSLSGPVASTGEILVTGSYELPRGMGSQGHAHGTTDGKDVDAVLIDGELPASSSPTPIAASSAVSTIKPAGEVIRPPAPEKGNKLMLILAITAGGLALALAVVLVVAFTTNVF